MELLVNESTVKQALENPDSAAWVDLQTPHGDSVKIIGSLYMLSPQENVAHARAIVEAVTERPKLLRENKLMLEVLEMVWQGSYAPLTPEEKDIILDTINLVRGK